MDEASTMTVSPPLPPKARNCRDPVQDTRQTTVSIQTIQSLSLPVIPVVGGPAEAGATVFVGGTVPSPTSAPTWRTPEVKKSSTYETRLHQEHQPQSQSVHHQQKHLDTRQPQPQSLQAAHVVKIRINPDDAAGKVVSTVRVTLDENKFEGVNGIIGGSKNNNNNNNSSNHNNYNNNNNHNGHNNNNNHNNHNNNNNNTNHNNNTIRKIGQSEASKNGVVLSTTNVNVNGSSSSIGSDGCVRISVGSNEVDLQREEMVQREIPNSLNSSSNRTSSCFYYSTFQNGLGTMVMSSGQCSPSDTLDSGTCSDLDGTPPPLPKKKNASSTVILGAGQHVRTGSLTSSGADIDSDEDDDDASNVSCDSLNSSELNAANRLNSANRLDGDNSDESNREEFSDGKSGPFAKSRIGIGDDDDAVSRDSGVTDVASPGNERADRREKSAKEISYDKVAADKIAADSRDADDCSMSVSSSPRLGGRASSSSSSGASTLSKASTTPRVRSPEFLQEIKRSPPMVKECAYEDKKMERMRLQDDAVAKELYANYNRGTGNKYLYDDDRFYKFHLNEHHAGEQRQMGNLEEAEGDEFFAGYKMLDREAIRSARGTVRGVKNRVRAGIATFLQQPATKNYKLKDAGKVVVYTTTMGIVRETYYACMKVKQILRTHMVKYEDRDMFMSTEYQAELRDRLQTTIIQVPQLFIDGQYIGDAEVVERLNESGELRRMLKPYKSPDACTTCQICGGYRLLPCPVCNGSKKSVHRNDFTTEFVALKCMNCDEVGLVRCQHC